MAHPSLFRNATPAALVLAVAVLPAQSPVKPPAFSVTVRYEIPGTPVRTTYRLGSKVLVEMTPPPGIPPVDTAGPKRILYLLDSKQSVSWYPTSPTVPCSRTSFEGEEGLDPFAGAADLKEPDATVVGTESIAGITAKIVVSPSKPGFKLWVDPNTGLMLKAAFAEPESDKSITYFEVTAARFEQPPAALFEIPAHCALPPRGSESTAIGRQ